MILPMRLKKEWPAIRKTECRDEDVSFSLRINTGAVKTIPFPLQEAAHSDNVGIALRLPKPTGDA